MSKTYESKIGKKFIISLDEKIVADCDAKGVDAYQQAIDAIEKLFEDGESVKDEQNLSY